MKNEHKKNLDRRDFLKVLGGAAAVTSATLLPGCKNKQESAYTATTDIPTDQMTYRINPSTQDRVSLLGYGCMRWPTVSNNSARDSSDDIDQETVNKLVDVAITHGVNYFDTSPAYCKGRSERATGIALSRYPRDKYFIATKLSNFAPSTWSREASIAMYHNSFKELYWAQNEMYMGGDRKKEKRFVGQRVVYDDGIKAYKTKCLRGFN